MVMTLYTIVPVLAVMGVSVYVLVLLIRALRKYLRTAPVRAEKAETAKTLGAVLKQHRTACKMTQEFVAESIGVSRQAVSKWESGPTRAHPICSRWRSCSASTRRSCSTRRKTQNNKTKAPVKPVPQSVDKVCFHAKTAVARQRA